MNNNRSVSTKSVGALLLEIVLVGFWPSSQPFSNSLNGSFVATNLVERSWCVLGRPQLRTWVDLAYRSSRLRSLQLGELLGLLFCLFGFGGLPLLFSLHLLCFLLDPFHFCLLLFHILLRSLSISPIRWQFTNECEQTIFIDRLDLHILNFSELAWPSIIPQYNETCLATWSGGDFASIAFDKLLSFLSRESFEKSCEDEGHTC